MGMTDGNVGMTDGEAGLYGGIAGGLFKIGGAVMASKEAKKNRDTAAQAANINRNDQLAKYNQNNARMAGISDKVSGKDKTGQTSAAFSNLNTTGARFGKNHDQDGR